MKIRNNVFSPQEMAGIQFICGDNEKALAVVEEVVARQRGSVELHQRGLASLSGTPSLLSYESPILPLCADRASGARIVDVDGNEYIDCHLAYTASILGHNPPIVEDTIRQALGRGLGGGSFFKEQVELAELVREMVPGLERVAFFHTGGEAVSASVRLARTATRKNRVAKFEGCYHGSNEIGLHNTWMILSGQMPMGPIDKIAPSAATGGVRTGQDADFLILPFNSPVAFERLREQAEELACVVVDPLPPFMMEWPEESKAFLSQLGALASDAGVPLVYDEVVCGFRLAKGGAREWAGVTPQMSCFGKITSGLGIPLSIVGGDARFLDAARTDGLFRDYASGKAWLASTLSCNFVAVIAALAQLRFVSESYDELMGRIDRSHAQLRARLQSFARTSGIPAALQGHPRTQLQLSVGKTEPAEKSYRGMMSSASPTQLRSLMAMTFYLRRNGIYTKIIPTMNLSAAHTEEDIDRLADGIEKSLLEMEEDRMLVY